MRPIALLLALATLLTSALPADAFIARNRLIVNPTADPNVMEVVGRSGASGSQFFCAAGDYARGPLRARASDRVVVVRPVERSARYNGRRTVLFALVRAGQPVPRQTAILLDPSFVGENLTVGHARFLCNLDRRGGFFD